MACAKVKAAVSGFDSEFAGQVRVRTVECETPEGKEVARRYGFQSHGLLIFDPQGELLFVRRDHSVDAAEVHRVLAEAVAKRPPPRR
jgi:hypothetical protein